MKRIVFIDGPLNGQKDEFPDDQTQYDHYQVNTFLPPTTKHFVYKEMVPGYWHVTKEEIEPFGI